MVAPRMQRATQGAPHQDNIGPHSRYSKSYPRKYRAWTKRDIRIFFGELELSCNVSRACRKIGRSASTAYAMRHRDPQFAADWSVAIDCGYAHLEARLLQIAIAQVDDDYGDQPEHYHGTPPTDTGRASKNSPTDPAGKFDTTLALRIVAAHQKNAADKTTSPPVPMASDAETDAIILKQLMALHKRNFAERAQISEPQEQRTSDTERYHDDR